VIVESIRLASQTFLLTPMEEYDPNDPADAQ
jgi:hypothetical protein